jgi:hypothetical protein
MLGAWAAFQRTEGQKRVRMLVAFCVVHMADAVIEADVVNRNLQSVVDSYRWRM